MMRGEIRRHTFKFPEKRRPVLILTLRCFDSGVKYSNGCADYNYDARARTQVILDAQDGMDETCAINLTNIQTVSKDRIEGFITHLSDERMQEVYEAIKFAFGFDK